MGIVGFVDFVSPRRVSGWAFHVEAPDEHLLIEVALDSIPIGQSVANLLREDLAKAGIGGGDHAFEMTLEATVTRKSWQRLVVVAVSNAAGTVELPIGPDVEVPIVNDEEAKSAPFAEDAALLPPVGFPADFIDEAAIASRTDWTGQDAPEVADAMIGDHWAIPHPDNRENYAPNSHLDYWLSGYGDFRFLGSLAAQHGVSEGDLLDFGGSTGRVFRHFAAQGWQWRVWSCNIKRSSFAFNLTHFPRPLRIFMNSSVPSLPIPDNTFDLILACSVFTQIDDAESAWLLELRRVLKIGGIALISIYNGETWRAMSPSFRETVERFRPDIASAPELPADRVVIPLPSDSGRNLCTIFRANFYISRNWGRYFEIVGIEPLTSREQAVVVCRRTD